MALPTTIVSEAARGGYAPPYKSSAGSFYAIVVSDPSVATLHAYKADGDDPSDAWTLEDTGPQAGTVAAFATVQESDVIHCVYFANPGDNGAYRYASFNMATDAWSGAQEIDGPSPNDQPTTPWCSIAVRADGDIIVAYNAGTDQEMGGKKERVDYAREEGSGWTASIALEADDGADEHYGNPNVVRSPLTDDMHFLWQQTANTTDPPVAWEDNEARTLDPSNNLSSVISETNHSTVPHLLGRGNGLSYEDAGTQRMLWGGIGLGLGNSGDLSFIRATEDGSDDIQSLAGSSITPTATEGFANGETGIISVAELDEDIHVIYSGGGADGVDKDIYYTKSTDDGATWDTPTEELDAVTCNFISGSIYVRDGDTVLAYVYDDAGVQKYNEKVLIAGAVVINPALLMKPVVGVRYY